MNLTRGRDAEGAYYRWGGAGHGGTKYHYTAGNAASRGRAKARAMTQAVGASKRGAKKREDPNCKTPKPSAKTGGKTPRKPRKRTVSSSKRAKQKMADKTMVAKTASYRRAAKR
jgi:hypothetical protein